jgi:hypothetical protein
MDLAPDPAPDPALFVSYFQGAKNDKKLSILFRILLSVGTLTPSSKIISH